MCRYNGFTAYKEHYACFGCRKAYKARNIGEGSREFCGGKGVCPQCGQPATHMSRDFRAPPMADVKGWEAARLVRFGGGGLGPSCGCPVLAMPTAPRAVPAFLASIRRVTRGELLLLGINARRRARGRFACGGRRR